MHGILALYHVGGAEVERAFLSRLVARLDHRDTGRDQPPRIDVWCEGPIGLAQAGGRLLCDLERGLTVSVDARIDNRVQLGAQFGWTRAEAVAASDAQVILEAYVRWGLDAPKHLVGDFSYALWDAGERRLVCARDPIGIRPLFYTTGPFGLICASEVKALLAHPAVARRPNEARIAQYLSQQPGNSESTFYRDVRRVQPGHWLVHKRDEELHVRRYWSIEDAPELGHNGESDEDLVEQFGETFREAVRCRIDPGRRTGVMLSGGLDSSSVAAVARHERRPGTSIPTFSATFPGVPEGERERIDEERYVRMLADLPGIDSHLVPVTEVNPLDDLDTVVARLDHPPVVCNVYLYRALHAAARAAGVSVLLDGAEGDDTVSYGQGWLCELAANGCWTQLAGEAQALVRRAGGGTPEHIYWNFGAPFLGKQATTWSALRDSIRAARAFDLSLGHTLWHSALKPRLPKTVANTWDRLRGGAGTAPSPSLVHPDLAHHVDMMEEEEGNAPLELPESDREAHAATFRKADDSLALILEEIDHLGRWSGVEHRHPFYDVRLVEVGVGLPGRLKLHDGWPRYVLRAAMTGLLPDDIRWRPDKSDLSFNFRRNVLRHVRSSHDHLLNHSALMPFIDRAVLRDALERSDSVAAWHALALAQWLDHAFSGGSDSSFRRPSRPVADTQSVSFHIESDSTHEQQPV